MKLHFRSLFVFVALFVLVLSGCALPHNGPPFYIYTPHDRTIYPLGNDIIVQYRTNIGQDSHRTGFEVAIFDNGVRVGHVFYGGNLIAASFTIPRPPAGGHLLSAQGRALYGSNPPSQWYTTAVICTFVGTPPAGTSFCSTEYNQSAQGIQVQPTLTPTPTPIPVIDSVQGYPSPIYYGETCPSVSTVNFRAALTLPNGLTPDLVTVQAHVSINVGSGGSSSGNLLVPLTSNGTWDATSGGQVFVGTLALSHSYNDANNHFDPVALGGSSGALLWYVDASSHDPTYSTATFLGRSANQVISLSPCPVGPIPQHNSNKGGSGAPASGCGQYTNQISCNLGGCSWNGTSCTVNP